MVHDDTESLITALEAVPLTMLAAEKSEIPSSGEEVRAATPPPLRTSTALSPAVSTAQATTKTESSNTSFVFTSQLPATAQATTVSGEIINESQTTNEIIATAKAETKQGVPTNDKQSDWPLLVFVCLLLISAFGIFLTLID